MNDSQPTLRGHAGAASRLSWVGILAATLLGWGLFPTSAAAHPGLKVHTSVSRRHVITVSGRAFYAPRDSHVVVWARYSFATSKGLRKGPFRRVADRDLRPSGRFVIRVHANGTVAELKTALDVNRHGTDPVVSVVTADVVLCGGQVDIAAWLDRDPKAPQGWTLSILPSACGRATGLELPQSMLNEAVRDAGGWKPNLNQPSMLTQLECHAALTTPFGFPIKTYWNLDGWRPNASFTDMLAEGCNPGPESPPEPAPTPPPTRTRTPTPKPTPTPTPAPAPLPGGEFYVQNADGGIYWRSAPDWNTAEATPGNGFYSGTVIKPTCYQAGAANVPGSADGMWEQASWVSGSGSGSGWVNEHFIADNQPINQPSPGVPACPSSAPPPPPPPQTWSEQETPNHPVNTFTNYHNASGIGPQIAAGQWVQVSCKVYDPTIQSVNPDGYWYRIASSPWDNTYYSPANTFMNGDPYGGPYTHNTDFAVPNC